MRFWDMKTDCEKGAFTVFFFASMKYNGATAYWCTFHAHNGIDCINSNNGCRKLTGKNRRNDNKSGWARTGTALMEVWSNCASTWD